MPFHETTIEREVVVEYDIIPGSKGSRGPYGEPMEPDEPADIEITSVKDAATGHEFGDALTADQEEALKDELTELLAEDWPEVEKD